MKKQVWKFKLGIGSKNKIEMPIGAKILTIQSQDEIPYVWALVDPNNETETRQFETYGTGHEIHYDMGTERIYIDTFMVSRGDLVFHVFERIN